MSTFFKNLVTYIKNLINGDEYVSDRTKVSYTITAISIIHVLIAVFRCMMRKAPIFPTDAYLLYVKVEYRGLTKSNTK